MSDTFKRVVIDGSADGFISTIERVKESIDSLGSTKVSKALGEIFDESLQGAKNLQDVMGKLKNGINEMKSLRPDHHRNFAAERADIEARFKHSASYTTSGRETHTADDYRKRDAALGAIDRDEHDFRQEQEAQKEFKGASRKLVEVIERLIKEEEKRVKEAEKKDKKHQEDDPGNSYINNLRAQKASLVNAQLQATTKKAAKGYTRDISSIDRELTEIRGKDSMNLRGMGAGMLNSVTGTNLGGLFSGIGMAGIAFGVYELLKNVMSSGLETTRAVIKGAMVSDRFLDSKGVTDRYGKGFDTNVHLGMSGAEFVEYAIASARNKGIAEINSGEIAYQQARMERAYGLNKGDISKLDRFSMRDSGNQDASETILQFLQIAKNQKAFGIDRDDFSQFADRIQIANELLRTRSQTVEHYDTRDAFAALLFGKNIGGSFSDRDTQAARLGTLNNAISSPSNDFARAFVYQSIQKTNPKMSFYELMEQMENGMYNGNLESVIQNIPGGIPGRSSSKTRKENFFLQLQGLTGLNYQQTRQFGESVMNNSGVLDIDKYRNYMAGVMNAPLDEKGRNFTGRSEDAITGYDKMLGSFKEAASDLGTAIIGLTSAVKDNTHAVKKDSGTENPILKPNQ